MACATGPDPVPTPRPDRELFAVEHQKDIPSIDGKTSKLVLRESGSWSYDDSIGVHHTGVLAPDAMTRVRADLARASWNVDRQVFACAAYDARFTTYAVHGKLVWTLRMCTPEHLDATSQAQLDDIVKILGPDAV
jgi:hypothetical protein